jgi:putative flippase GtrA
VIRNLFQASRFGLVGLAATAVHYLLALTLIAALVATAGVTFLFSKTWAFRPVCLEPETGITS